MKIDILTLFPEMFNGPFSESIIKRAQEKGLVEISMHNLRDWAIDKHGTVDDKPYSGGPGMVIRVDVVDNALRNLRKRNTKVLLMSPQGKTYSQQMAQELATDEHIILIAGHYEGFDHRIVDNLIDEQISIGDYILTGGELPAMIIVDSIVRLLPEALGDQESLANETHFKPGFKKFPVYTRPEEYKGWKVPEVLLSGNHKEIKAWEKENS